MRGSIGATGPAGPSGLIAPPIEITFTPEQSITELDGTTMVLLATTPSLVAGTYCVWVEHDYVNNTAASGNFLYNSFYGIYVGSTLWSNQRQIGVSSIGLITPAPDQVWRKASIFHIVTITGLEVLPTINLRYTINSGAITCGNGTIIYQKIA